MAKAQPLRWVALLLILIGVGWRFHLLGADVRFHPDEAYYAAFARAFAVRGDVLLVGNLDKPPLALWGQALMMATMGVTVDENGLRHLDLLQGEFVARLWSGYASVLILAVGYRLAHDALSYQQAISVLAGLSLSPLLIAFSSTTFTDTPMILFGMLAVMLAFRRRVTWSGVCLALAYGNKQQALLLVPLVALVLVHRVDIRRWQEWARFALGFGGIMGLLMLYDGLRPPPSIFALATQHNQPQRWLVPLGELPMRAVAWWKVLRWTGVTALALVFPFRLASPLMRLVHVWLIGYVLLHWLSEVRIYDRYVLLIEPFLILMVVAVVYTGFPRRAPIILGVMFMLMIPFAWYASTARLPIGGDRGQHQGIVELAHYLNGREFGAIVYDRWLGWELNYYLGEWTDKRRAYYPTPFAMLNDPTLLVADVAPRYFPAPLDVGFGAWQQALHTLGYQVCEGYRQDGFVVYVLLERYQLQHHPSYRENAQSACMNQR